MHRMQRGMGFHSPYFLLLTKVDRISIIGSNADMRKSLPVPPAAHLMVDCNDYTGCNQSRENVDVTRDICKRHYYVTEEIFYYCPEERSYYSKDKNQPEIPYKVPLIAEIQYQSASKAD